MRRVSVLLAVVLTALSAAAPADGAKRRPVKKQLTTFRSCDGLVSFAERRVKRWGPDVFGSRRMVSVAPPVAAQPVAGRDMAGAESAPAASAPVAGTDYSGTNVQEAGIDEPDAVKTDGRRLYVTANQKLHAIDITGPEPRIVGTLPLEGYGHELLLRGDKLLVLSTGGFEGPMPMPMPAQGTASPPPESASPPARAASSPLISPYLPRTTLLEVDAREMKVLRSLELPGTVVGGRLRGSTARVAISTPTGMDPAEGDPKLRRWMPAMEIQRATGATQRRSIAPCTSVRRPQVFAGLGLLTVLTIDLDRGVQPVDSDAVLADASTVYASANRMYLATERWVDPDVAAQDGIPVGRSTLVHGFDVARDDATRYVGSGGVPGYLLNQFSMSEHRGALRVATTEDPPWLGIRPDGESESFVTVLDETDGRLAQVGRVGGLGKGERIFAVRFVDDVGFVVTFRQTDPLYTLDLSDRTAPRVVGELKIPGYSSYLHPAGDDLLIGVGQDADETGRTTGTQVSLFDVSDLRDPRRLHQRRLGTNAYSTAENDHHAVLWWPATKLLVMPLGDYSERGEQSFNGAVGMRVDRAAGIAEAGRTEHPRQDGYSPSIDRAVVANDRLFTISWLGIQAGRLDTLAGTAWVPFPQ